jgi:hypothetical protein
MQTSLEARAAARVSTRSWHNITRGRYLTLGRQLCTAQHVLDFRPIPSLPSQRHISPDSPGSENAPPPQRHPTATRGMPVAQVPCLCHCMSLQSRQVARILFNDLARGYVPCPGGKDLPTSYRQSLSRRSQQVGDLAVHRRLGPLPVFHRDSRPLLRTPYALAESPHRRYW